MHRLLLGLLCVVLWSVCAHAACTTWHHNRSACLAVSGCVFSNFSQHCCLWRGPNTCPDLEQGALLQNGGVYAAIPVTGSILFIACIFAVAVLARPPWK